MSLRSGILAFLASLLIIGRTTKQQQQFTPAQTALEEKDQRGEQQEIDSRIHSQPTNGDPRLV
jgi:response regulator of citrate/malate metabolism